MDEGDSPGGLRVVVHSSVVAHKAGECVSAQLRSDEGGSNEQTDVALDSDTGICNRNLHTNPNHESLSGGAMVEHASTEHQGSARSGARPLGRSLDWAISGHGLHKQADTLKITNNHELHDLRIRLRWMALCEFASRWAVAFPRRVRPVNKLPQSAGSQQLQRTCLCNGFRTIRTNCRVEMHYNSTAA